MPENSFFNRLFNEETIAYEERYELTRKTRLARMREILHIIRKHDVKDGVSPAEFRAILEDLGPTFMKIGQVLSTRSEILPQAYCDELSHLQANTTPLPFDEVVAALDAIYGDRRGRIFKSIDPKPLGSASLAQVHKAVLLNGDEVAVKVQRPGVRTVMAQDIDVLRSLVKHLDRFIPNDQMLDFHAVVEELWVAFVEETDFTREAENLREFALLNRDVAFVSCPEPYLEYCTPDVLVMEYVDGTSIRNTEEIVDAGYDLAEIGDKMMDNYAKQILDDGFFHADPHPGNIVIKDGKIVYLDLGIMGRLSSRDRSAFGEIIKAVGLQNASALKDALISFAIDVDIEAIDHPRLLSELDNVLSSYASCDVADIDIGAFLTDILALTRQCKVTLPASVTAVSRALVTLEGTVLAYVGSFNIADIINRRLRREQMKPEALGKALEDTLVDLRAAGEGINEAATYSGEMMRMLTRGQFKVNMNMLGSDEPLAKLSRIVNRMTLGLMIAGLLVSGALISSVEGMPKVFGLPVLADIMFISAFVLSAVVVMDFYRKRK
ncbi:MAG: lipopolysaccharide core heptose(II) kinase RfaY [Coriobacteriia bacterium]|nr:lipopolysaccharide core heptose(II) kinase RfaY [Coriobacteriia bacterium]